MSSIGLWKVTHKDASGRPSIVQRPDGFQLLRVGYGTWHGQDPNGRKVRHPNTGKTRAFGLWHTAANAVDEQYPPETFRDLQGPTARLTIDQRRHLENAAADLAGGPRVLGLVAYLGAASSEAMSRILERLDGQAGRSPHNTAKKLRTAWGAPQQAHDCAPLTAEADHFPDPRRDAELARLASASVQEQMQAWVRHPNNKDATLGDLADAFGVSVTKALALRDGKGADAD